MEQHKNMKFCFLFLTLICIVIDAEYNPAGKSVDDIDHCPVDGDCNKIDRMQFPMVQVLEKALSPALLNVLQKDAILLRKLSDNQNIRSIWFPLPRSTNKPRYALEQVVLLLHQIAFPDKDPTQFEQLKGAEVWVQYRASGKGMPPHFDKDENSFWQKKSIVYAVFIYYHVFR